jgi:hypothetical protein
MAKSHESNPRSPAVLSSGRGSDWSDARFGKYQNDFALNGVDMPQVGRSTGRLLASVTG